MYIFIFIVIIRFGPSCTSSNTLSGYKMVIKYQVKSKQGSLRKTISQKACNFMYQNHTHNLHKGIPHNRHFSWLSDNMLMQNGLYRGDVRYMHNACMKKDVLNTSNSTGSRIFMQDYTIYIISSRYITTKTYFLCLRIHKI